MSEEGDAFEGDIVLTPVQKMLIDQGRDLAEASFQRGASVNRQWPGGIVPYVIEKKFGRLNMGSVQISRSTIKTMGIYIFNTSSMELLIQFVGKSSCRFA